jgi:hypothetical protein
LLANISTAQRWWQSYGAIAKRVAARYSCPKQYSGVCRSSVNNLYNIQQRFQVQSATDIEIEIEIAMCMWLTIRCWTRTIAKLASVTQWICVLDRRLADTVYCQIDPSLLGNNAQARAMFVCDQPLISADYWNLLEFFRSKWRIQVGVQCRCKYGACANAARVL